MAPVASSCRGAQRDQPKSGESVDCSVSSCDMSRTSRYRPADADASPHQPSEAKTAQQEDSSGLDVSGEDRLRKRRWITAEPERLRTLRQPLDPMDEEQQRRRATGRRQAHVERRRWRGLVGAAAHEPAADAEQGGEGVPGVLGAAVGEGVAIAGDLELAWGAFDAARDRAELTEGG